MHAAPLGTPPTILVDDLEDGNPAPAVHANTHLSRLRLDSKALSGFLVGYAEDGRGYELWIPETNSLVTTVHVIINEVIPQYTREYFAELEAHLKAVAVKTGPTATLQDYELLKSTCHLDDEDGLVYRVTRVAHSAALSQPTRMRLRKKKSQSMWQTSVA
jgi:hypothetical protein